MHGGVLTHYISENKKSYTVTQCRTKGVYQAQSASSYALILYYTESLQQDDTQGVDMRYPLKYDTTKKESLDFNYL